MLSLSDNNQAVVIKSYNSTSKYVGDLLNINNPYFVLMIGQVYPTEHQLNKANFFDTESKKDSKDQESIQSITHLPQDTKWENNKITINIANKSR